MIIKDTMTDYKQGKIYAIRSPNTDKYYIGSTATTLCKRFYQHKTKSNDTSSAEIIAFGNAYIELIELYPCNSKMELNKREGELQREMKEMIVNKYFAHRTPEQHKEEKKTYNAAYQAEHKEEIKAYQAEHKEEIKAYQAAYHAEHKEEKKAYNAEHKEEIKAYQAAYQAEHKEEIKAKQAEYDANHKEEKKAYNAAYRVEHKAEKKARAKAYYAAKRDAKKQTKTD